MVVEKTNVMKLMIIYKWRWWNYKIFGTKSLFIVCKVIVEIAHCFNIFFHFSNSMPNAEMQIFLHLPLI